MKKIFNIALFAAALAVSASCAKLDLNPLSAASSENWYADADEIVISLNDLYRTYPYGMHTEFWTDRRCDDWAQRDQVYELCNGSVTSTTSTYESYWLNSWKAISRCNRIIEAIEQRGNPDNWMALKAEACFFRAFFYGRMIILWGDVPFYLGSVTMEEAFKMGRTDKAVIEKQVYADFKFAIENLPESNTMDGVWRVNKYVAKAIKARFAANMKDWAICAEECKGVMDSGAYKLYYSTTNPADSYGELFRDKTMSNGEFIWTIPYSIELGTTEAVKSWVLRTAGGTATAQPSWDLLAAYECTDGKTINESPLFDPHDPFKNRDPRCGMTFAVPGSIIYGCEFNPCPSATNVMLDGASVKNKDTRANDQYAAYCGTCLRKGAQEEWRTLQMNENPWIMIRYADVLLMYAEAKCELNEIDATVLNAINDVRARAYGVKRSDGGFPQITETDQDKLRRLIRKERRVELAWEGRRWFDVRRWGMLKKMYSHHYYGFLNQTDIKTYNAAGNWYWPEAPVVDEDGFADFTAMEEKGYILRYGEHKYDPKVELFPIPSEDIKVCTDLEQNPGY